MNTRWLGILVASLVCAASTGEDKITSVAMGMYHPDEKTLLVPTFVNSVNSWLHRYEPKLVQKDADYVKMQVKYDYLFDIELIVTADGYEVRVTKAETKAARSGQKQAAKLASGVNRTMENSLLRSVRIRERRPSAPAQ